MQSLVRGEQAEQSDIKVCSVVCVCTVVYCGVYVLYCSVCMYYNVVYM